MNNPGIMDQFLVGDGFHVDGVLHHRGNVDLLFLRGISAVQVERVLHRLEAHRPDRPAQFHRLAVFVHDIAVAVAQDRHFLRFQRLIEHRHDLRDAQTDGIGDLLRVRGADLAHLRQMPGIGFRYDAGDRLRGAAQLLRHPLVPVGTFGVGRILCRPSAKDRDLVGRFDFYRHIALRTQSYGALRDNPEGT